MKESVIIVIILLAACIALVLKLVLSKRSLSWITGLKVFAWVCVVIGLAGFFGMTLSSGGALDWLPETFEWPVDYADNVLIIEDTILVVPHESSGRIQLYNKELEFIRGWSVPGLGGREFIPISAGKDEIYVYEPVAGKRYHYTIYGKLLSYKKYDIRDFPKFEKTGKSIKIPIPFYLKIFARHIRCWVVFMVGLGLAAHLKVREDNEKKFFLPNPPLGFFDKPMKP